ncbi:hypothetical protein L208DRAFT_1316665 [Tricholoma matsutake]|nr:hypothetical protein L208DRAFT_1316665 [Tricholoma matsutake 945]
MGYWVLESMSYGFHFPAYQLGSSKILWGMREYGLPGVWVKRVSTVQLVLPSLEPHFLLSWEINYIKSLKYLRS